MRKIQEHRKEKKWTTEIKNCKKNLWFFFLLQCWRFFSSSIFFFFHFYAIPDKRKERKWKKVECNSPQQHSLMRNAFFFAVMCRRFRLSLVFFFFPPTVLWWSVIRVCIRTQKSNIVGAFVYMKVCPSHSNGFSHIEGRGRLLEDFKIDKEVGDPPQTNEIEGRKFFACLRLISNECIRKKINLQLSLST